MPAAEATSGAVYVTRAVLILAACATALFNGSLWSPLFDSVAYILYLATRGYPFMTAARASDATPFAIALMTLLIAGIPAALYERIRGLRASNSVSLAIWLVATLILTAPTIARALGEE